MKPTFKTTALAILVALGVTACSGGGGGASANQAPQPSNLTPSSTTNKPANTTKSPEKTQAQSNQTQKNQAQNNPTQNNQAQNNQPQTPTVQPLVLELPDNTKIDLAKLTKEEEIPETKTANGSYIGYNGISSFYGVWKDTQNTKNSFEEFYKGVPATNVPTSGSAKYKGKVAWVDDDSGNSLKRGGETTLEVDFGNKTVEGLLTFSSMNDNEFRRDITLEKTKLVDTKFKGNATAKFSSITNSTGGKLLSLVTDMGFVSGLIGETGLLNEKGTYEGELFGENAEEVAGKVQFEKDHNLDVSFGGVKQVKQ